MEEKCVYCGGDLPEKPTKVKVRTRSFEVCCADCAEKTEQYIKLDKRFKTALYLLVFLGGIGFVISAFFGGDSPLRMMCVCRSACCGTGVYRVSVSGHLV